MADISKQGGPRWRVVLAVVAGLVLAGVVLHGVAGLGPGNNRIAEPARESATKSDLARFAVGPLAALQTPAVPAAAPDYGFRTPAGAEVRFADFHGRVVVVNLWALWCVPCRTEMPTLAALQRAYPAPALQVLAINVDVGAEPIDRARAFLVGHAPLAFYSDPKFQLPFEFPGKGKMPQTILLDRQGRVRAAYAGGADWNSPQARALVEAVMAEPAAERPSGGRGRGSRRASSPGD